MPLIESTNIWVAPDSRLPLKVIYHANCLDGFGAAYVVWRWYNSSESTRRIYKEPEFLPANYGEPAPELRGFGAIFIVDFSYPAEVLEDYARDNRLVVVLDHHKTAIEKLAGLCGGSNLELILNTSHSGVGLTWNYFFPEQQPARLLISIEDRDLWQFKYPFTREITAALSELPKDFNAWKVFESQLEHYPETVINLGAALMRQHERFSKSIAERCFEVTIHVSDEKSYRGLCCECPPEFASEVGNILAAKSGTFGLCFFTTKEGLCQCSFRSIGDYDVTEIAGSFGGGGHRNAAGARINPIDAVNAFEFPRAAPTGFWSCE